MDTPQLSTADDGLLRTVARRFTMIDPAVDRDDALSECRLAVAKAKPGFVPQRGAWSTYAWRVASRRMSRLHGNAMAHAGRRAGYAGRLASPVERTPSDAAVAAEDRQRLLAAVESLPAREAQAVKLVHLRQVGQPQALRALKVNPEQLSALLASALARLQVKLGACPQ